MTKVIITGIVTISILGLLLWQHFYGEVPSHHILNRKDLPEISNWWGGLLLPILTWVLLSRIEKRIGKDETSTRPTNNQTIKIVGLFIIGLIFGLALAISFTHEYKPFLDNVLYILLAMSLIVPIFFPEFIIGFILGMTYTFGAVLPTAFIIVIAIFGFLIYRFIRPLILKVVKVFTK